ncbi:Clavaminate synthase-like protein [Irpex rosettiformis]|uniref:Clavaminate synthase-like protein n=1 Tax=Irpex rosettiformis TaxID=378272 RepID=A0ACB8TXU2_9APHY|nr:Clavaminate synthase-like protein [Irpex rosettiformis]
MARTKRRSTRNATKGSPEPEPTTHGEEQPSVTPPDSQASSESHTVGQHKDRDRCPSCKEGEETTGWNETDKESWVRCDACKKWFHWRCVGEGELEVIDKWFCTPCRELDPKRVVTQKPPARKSSRKRAQRDYAGLNGGNEQDSSKWLRMMQGKPIKLDPFKRMAGSDVTVEWIDNDLSALTEPIVIETSEGLGMKMPEGFTVGDVAHSLGEETPVEVIDVSTQSNLPGWNLGKWAEYYATEPGKRDKIRNVISLEISDTPLADKVLPPRIVRDLDWVDKFWPNKRKGRGHLYPKVQLYCLMGVANAWTDWHIDFAGSSVYYHILHGSKVFYFIRPTAANLAAYERWSGSEVQSHAWLGDMCDEVFKIELHTGNTMIIPTGWIHAVYTPIDTLVFGGNFLHSYNVATQLRVREIEVATHVPKKFRFPYFIKLCWYAAEKYLRDLRAKEEFSSRVLESVEALAEFLVGEVRTMERGSESAKREAKDQVPSDCVKDAPSLARELRWRVRLTNGYASDDDSKHRRKGNVAAPSSAAHHSAVTKKRKRGEADTEVDPDGSYTPFLHFKPRSWDAMAAYPTEKDSRAVKSRRPIFEQAEWAKELLDWKDGGEDAEDAPEAAIERRRDVIVKVRRTEKGIERQRVERVLEEWSWTDDGTRHSANINLLPDSVSVKAESNGAADVVMDGNEDKTHDQ